MEVSTRIWKRLLMTEGETLSPDDFQAMVPQLELRHIGYFPPHVTTAVALQKCQWLRVFVILLRRHAPLFRGYIRTSLEMGKPHIDRWIRTQKQKAYRQRAAERRWFRQDAYDAYESLDLTVLGILRYFSSLRRSEFSPARFYVRHVPRNRPDMHWLLYIFLGGESAIRTQSSAALLQAARSMPVRPPHHLARIRHFLLQVEGEYRFDSFRALEDCALRQETSTWTAQSFADQLTTIARRMPRPSHVRRQLLDMAKKAHSPSSQMPPPPTPPLPPPLPTQDEETVSGDPSPLEKEIQRLRQLLDNHGIEHIQLPLDTVESVESFLADQRLKQAAIFHVLLSDTSTERVKFLAERDLAVVERWIRAGERKLFDFEDYRHHLLRKYESKTRVFVPWFRERLQRVYREVGVSFDIHPDLILQLPFKKRKCFPADDVQWFLNTSPSFKSTLLKLLWSSLGLVGNDENFSPLLFWKMESVRSSVRVLLDSVQSEHAHIPLGLLMVHLFGLDAVECAMVDVWQKWIRHIADTFPEISAEDPEPTGARWRALLHIQSKPTLLSLVV